MKITLVPPEHVFQVWPDIRGYLEPAVETSHGRWTLEHLLAVLCNGRSQLWIAFDDEGIWGALTTEITNYPAKRCLSMHFLGGTEFDRWYSDMLKQISHFGKEMDCDGIEGTARFGFWKFLKQDGFEKCAAFYEKGMKNG